ncbi:MAG TPA: A/G-specific adenine glycosylase [Pirellulaceae bacterium]|nr:A/G-specific adenine glycosylase [Pirellulaceae bacterium]
MEATTPSPDVATSRWKQQLQTRLLAWFSEHARDLPWRRTRDLYAIWISEIMLQQTQVVTVIDYFERFLRQFPTVRELATANEEVVLRYWEGLGYYRRARQLHAAAKQIVNEHQGEFPTTFAEVLALPGIGRYTAGAILSIGRDERLPILEANTIRVLSRLLAYRDDVYSTAGQKVLWQFAEEILPHEQVGFFNQSLMELGASLCTPREPSCLLCPVANLCPTRKAGQQASIPAPKQKTKYEELTEAVVTIRNRRGEVLVRRCQPGERWAGLWDFPRVPLTSERELSTAIEQLTGLAITLGERFTTIKHAVTRYRITLHGYAATHRSKAALTTTDNSRWIKISELHELPLSVTGRKIGNLLSTTAPLS